MKTRFVGLAVALISVAAFAYGVVIAPSPHQIKPEPNPLAPSVEVPQDRTADEAAIRQAALEFTAAFNKGDAKAVVALWTANGEMLDANGEAIRGRAALEKSFAGFFEQHPGAKVHLRIESIRFPSADVAIEDGIIRQTRGEHGLPSTTLYSTTHVREGAVWRVASSREWGAGLDRLEDLDWLVGTWGGTVGDEGVTLTIAKDAERPALVGTFTRVIKGQPTPAGTLRIALDPQSGQVRSWHFDADGGHGQAMWGRDGENWLLHSVGVLADGTETASVNILTRQGADAIRWRSIDRIAGGTELPATVPLVLKRNPAHAPNSK